MKNQLILLQVYVVQEVETTWNFSCNNSIRPCSCISLEATQDCIRNIILTTKNNKSNSVYIIP